MSTALIASLGTHFWASGSCGIPATASSLRLRQRLSLAQAVSGLRAAQLATLVYLHSLNLVWTRIVVEPILSPEARACDCGNIARGDLPEVFPGSALSFFLPAKMLFRLVLQSFLMSTLGSPFSKKSPRQANLLSTLVRGPPGAHDVDPLPVLRKPETAAVHHSPAHSIGPLLRPRKPTFLELLQKFVEVLLIPDARHILQHKSTQM